MFNNKYPYTDFHELNADYILQKLKELDAKVDLKDTAAIRDLILKNINAFLPNAVYDEDNRRISFDLDILIAGCKHIYNPNNETMTLENGGCNNE